MLSIVYQVALITLSGSQMTCEIVHSLYGPNASLSSQNKNACEFARAISAYTLMVSGALVISMGFMLCVKHNKYTSIMSSYLLGI